MTDEDWRHTIAAEQRLLDVFHDGRQIARALDGLAKGNVWYQDGRWCGYSLRDGAKVEYDSVYEALARHLDVHECLLERIVEAFLFDGIEDIHDEISIDGMIRKEFARAVKKFPTWPTDPIHASNVVAEELGELQKALNEYIYEDGKSTFEDITKEAVQLAAMARRFLLSLDTYQYQRCPQHEQEL